MNLPRVISLHTIQRPPSPSSLEVKLKCQALASSLLTRLLSVFVRWSESHSVVSDSLWPLGLVHGILQARILEWVAFPFSRGSSQPRDQTQVSHIVSGFFTNWAIREALCEGGLVPFSFPNWMCRSFLFVIWNVITTVPFHLVSSYVMNFFFLHSLRNFRNRWLRGKAEGKGVISRLTLGARGLSPVPRGRPE